MTFYFTVLSQLQPSSFYEEVIGQPIQATTSGSRYSPRGPVIDPFESALAELKALAELQVGWNGYEAPVPDRKTLSRARHVLGRLRDFDICPSRVMASVRGGTVLCFDDPPRFLSLEFFNSGATVLLKAQRPGPPEAHKIPRDSIEDAIGEIQEYVTSG